MHWIYQNYWVIGVLQLIAIIHAYRSGKTNWIYILIFLPLVGAAAYLIVEVLPGLQGGKLGFLTANLFDSRESIPELEKNLRISDTFMNRTALARAYASRKKYEQAIAMYQSALQGMYKDDLDVILQLGRLHFLNENYSESIQQYQRATSLNQGKFIRPDDELWLGISLLENKQYAEAEAVLQNHQRFHKTVDSLYYLGEVYRQQGESEKARAFYQKAIDQTDLIPKQNRPFHMQFVRKSRKALGTI